MRPYHLMACLLAAAPITTALATPATAAPPRPDTSTETAATATVGLTISLRSPHEQQLRSYAAAVSTPGNIRYRQYLTTAQLSQRFGARPGAATRVSAWARTAGFQVGALDATGTRLPLTGTAATVKKALGSILYDTVQDGARVRVATAVRLPPRIADDVTAVTGLNEQPAQPMHVRSATALTTRRGSCLSATTATALLGSCLARPAIEQSNVTGRRPRVDVRGAAGPAGNGSPEGWRLPPLQPVRNPGVCATSWASPDTAPVQDRSGGSVSMPVCGYTGPQLRALYGLRADDDGDGQTIVIVGAYNEAATLRDANTTFALNGVAPLPASRYRVKTYPGSEARDRGCDRAAWGREQAVDVQSAHTLAPAATIIYVPAADCTRLSDTLAQAIADPQLRGSVISNSWGYPAEALSNDELAATDAMLARAAVLGTGTYSASGLYGTATTSGMQLPDRAYPASSPWTTAVGGTTSAVGPGNTVLWQTGWASSGTALNSGAQDPTAGPLVAAAGGGTSVRESRPAWQRTSTAMRQVPDLAALADPHTGLLVGTTQDGRFGAGPVGGTGLATPIVASLAALAQARSGHPAGLIAPA
ncbi:protease pro-enzyme activation domain-containing protein [Actinoplanes sp. NPDC048988]|uniref:S53 family peptidase n=1 Tax=Actinoplanes sp. NPDC048988 TaxID=3363901 RepID=UPI00371BDB48